jgi:hypothetical protein
MREDWGAGSYSNDNELAVASGGSVALCQQSPAGAGSYRIIRYTPVLH